MEAWLDEVSAKNPPNEKKSTDNPADNDDGSNELEAQLDFERRVSDEVLRLRVRERAQRVLRIEVSPVTPDPVTLAQLLTEPDEDIVYRINELLPFNGRVVLAAQRKSGKTTLVGNLIRCLADGGDFLDKYTVTQPDGRIVNLDFEMPRGLARQWLRDQNVIRTDNVVFWNLRGSAAAFDLTDRGILKQWAQRLKAIECGFLIIDPLRPILDSIGLDENKDAGRFLVTIDELMELSGIPEMVLVHHAGHNGERSRGDSRLRDWPDAEWRLVRENNDTGEEPEPHTPRFFAAEGRDVSVRETRLSFDHLTRRLSLGDGSRRDLKNDREIQEALAAVIETLRDGHVQNDPGWEGMSKNQIESLALAKREAVRKALRYAVERGLVTEHEGRKRAILHRLRDVPGVE